MPGRTPIEQAARTRAALLELWPTLEAADAYAREYDDGEHGASFMHGALYAASAMWERKHGGDDDLYSDLDDELHETIKARGDLNERIRLSVEGFGHVETAVDEPPRPSTTTKHMDAKQLHATIQEPLEAILPLLVTIGAGYGTVPSVGFQSWTGNQADDPMLTESGRQVAAAAAARMEEYAESLMEIDMELVTPKHGETVRGLLYDAHYLFHLLAAALRGLEGTGSDALVTGAVMRQAEAFARRVRSADPGDVETASTPEPESLSPIDDSHEEETGTVVPPARAPLPLSLHRELVDCLLGVTRIAARVQRLSVAIPGEDLHRYAYLPLDNAEGELAELVERYADVSNLDTAEVAHV